MALTSGERSGLVVAVAGHAVLFGLLSVGFLATPNAEGLKSQPIDISLIDEVAFEAAAPASVEAPAESMAPDYGPLEDAPAPEPLPDAAQPQPPTPSSDSAPPPRPAPEAPPRPTPKRAAPEPEEAAPKAKPKPKAAPKRETRTAEKSKSAGEGGAKSRPKSSRLGDDFLKGVVGNESKGKAETPRANNVSAAAVASLGDAIKRQVQPCANRIASPGPGANQIVTQLRLQMQRNGSLAGRPEIGRQRGIDEGNRRYAQRVAELARAAVIQCAPYSLPAELYEGGWKDIIINYSLPG